MYILQSYLELLKRYCRSPKITSNPVSSKTSLAVTCQLDLSKFSTFSQTDYHRCYILPLLSQYNILILYSSYMVTIINLSFICYHAFHLSSFCKAISIFCHDSYCVATLFSSKAFKNASTWAILLPFLYLIVKSYCWSLHNHQALFPNGRSTVRIVSKTI